MKWPKMFLTVSTVFLICMSATVSEAGDFDWMRDFNARAEADLSGFRAQLSARFRIGDAQISAVLSNVPKPADAYMMFRLGEMTAKPPEYVMERYKAEKGKGWGVLAKSLGIKPGSSEFHALKRGHDLYGDHDKGKDKDKGKGGKKGKGRGRDKD